MKPLKLKNCFVSDHMRPRFDEMREDIVGDLITSITECDNLAPLKIKEYDYLNRAIRAREARNG